jgi:chromosome segregation ATPase
LLADLDADALRRYRALERRCQEIIEPQMKVSGSSPGLVAQMDGLGRLLWIYLRLLFTRQAIGRIVEEAKQPGSERGKIEARSQKLEEQLKEEGLSEELRKSLTGQLEILKQRLEKQREAREKVAFLEAELTRIQEQVELIREQAMLSTDPDTVSHRIDQVTATLDGTSQWMRDQQELLGPVEDLLTQPPPLAVPPSVKESA